jgi:excisionase family DNA binding protein
MRKIAYSVKEASTLLGVHFNTLHRAIKRGEIRAVRIGHRLIVPAAELERLGLLSNKETPAGAGGER